jgi:hypothetical protein
MSCRSLNYPFVSQWRRPSPELLAGERTIGGKPPFDPFLTASMIWETHVCPVAAIHELLHGKPLRPGGRTYSRTYGQYGESWHSYIGHLRLSIASRHLRLPNDIAHALAIIRHDFDLWVEEHMPRTDSEQLWRTLVEPYVVNRLQRNQFVSIIGHAILPEVYVGSSHVTVALHQGSRTYPIEARIDEIDLTSGTAIERTTMSTALALPSKMVQLAVGAAIMRSLPAPYIPQQWAALRSIRNFLIETPTDTVPVNPIADDLNHAIHDAAAIIRDIAASELAEWPIYQQAQCTPHNPHQFCSHPYINCYHSVPINPQARNAIKRETRRLARAELHELLWQRDLPKYRLYSPIAARLAYPGLPVDIVKTDRDMEGRPYVEIRIQGGGLSELEQGILIVGTPFVGVRREGTIEEEPTSGTIRIYCDIIGLPLSNTGILWPPTSEGVLMEQAPDFLICQRQSELFALRKIGTGNLQVAEQNSVIQLLEAVFGGTVHLET